MVLGIDSLLIAINVDVKQATTAIRSLQKSLLQAGLGVMFTGMAINRFFSNLAQKLIQNFLIIEGEGGLVNETLAELQAQLAFIGFQLIDIAVATGVFDFWINKIQILLDWFENLNEDTQAFIVNFIIGGVLVGIAMLFVGQGLLTILALLSLIDLVGLPLFLAILFILGLLIVAFFVWNSKLEKNKKIFIIIGLLLLSVIGIFLIIPLVIALIVAGILVLKDKFVTWGNVVKVILLTMGKIFFLVLISPFLAFIALIDLAIKGLNRLFRTNIPTIQSLGGKVFDFIDTKIAEIEAEAKALKAVQEGAKGLEVADVLGKGVGLKEFDLSSLIGGKIAELAPNIEAQKIAISEGIKESLGEGELGNITNEFNFEGFIGDESKVTDMVEKVIADKFQFIQGSPQG